MAKARKNATRRPAADAEAAAQSKSHAYSFKILKNKVRGRQLAVKRRRGEGLVARFLGFLRG